MKSVSSWFCLAVAIAAACKDTAEPPAPPVPAVFTGVAAGAIHTCAWSTNGDAFCWGAGTNGRLGTGNPQSSLTPAAVVGDIRFAALAAGGSHTCGRTPQFELYCWGNGTNGRVGVAGAQPANTTPLEVGAFNWLSVSAGWAHTCAEASGDLVACWGSNANGELTGTGDKTTPSTIAVPAPPPTAGGYHSCTRTRCWGLNTAGQLGDSSLTSTASPVPIRGGVAFTAVVAGQWHSCGLAQAGLAYCWGKLETAAGPDTVTVPRLVADTPAFAQLTTGASHTCGRTPSGAVYCWGGNASGELGRTGPPAGTPLLVALPSAAVAVAAGARHSCAVLADGSAYCWGANESGQLGNGSTVDSPTPARVSPAYSP